MDYKQLAFAISPFINSQLREYIMSDENCKIRSNIMRECNIESFRLNDLIEYCLNKRLNEYIEPGPDDIKETISKIRELRRQTRKNWLSLLIEELPNSNKTMKPRNPQSLTKEAISYFNLVKANPTLFDDMKKHSTIESYLEYRFKEIKKWYEDSDALLIHYCYFCEKTTKVQMNAFILDLTLDSLNIINHNFNGNPNGYIIVFPEQLIDYPVFSLTKTVMPIEQLIIQNELFVFNDYPMNDGYVRTSIKKGTAITKVKNLSLTVHNELDTIDREAFSVIYNKLYSMQTLLEYGDKLNISLRNLTQQTFQVQKLRKMHLLKMEDILAKLSNYNVTVNVLSSEQEAPLEYLSLNMLQSVHVYNDREERMVEITPSNPLIDAIRNEKHVKVLSSIYNLLESTHERTWLIILQNERIKCYNNCKKKTFISSEVFEITAQPSLIATLPFSYFKSKIKMFMKPSKIKQAVITNIEQLNHKKSIIKNYSYTNDKITIEFTDITQQEEILYGLR